MLRVTARFVLFLLPLMPFGGAEEISMKPATPRFQDLVAPFYDHYNHRLLFGDQAGAKFCSHDLHTDKTHCTSPQAQKVAAIVPIEEEKNKYYAEIGPYFGILDWDAISAHSSFTILRRAVGESCEQTVFTVGKTDRQGRFWAGAAEQTASGVAIPDGGILYQYTKGLCNLRERLEGIDVANGITWNPSSTKLYFVGCNASRVDVFDFDKDTGAISNRQTFVDFVVSRIPGQPRGLTTDVDGNIWIGCHGAHQIIKVDHVTKKVVKTLRLPAAQVTGLTWGGPHFEILYTTTTQNGLSHEEDHHQPWAGTIIAIDGLHERGLPSTPAIVCDQGQPISDDEQCPELNQGPYNPYLPTGPQVLRCCQ